MPPRVALLACFGLIAALLALDSDSKSKVSTALWIPTIWMLIIASRMVSEWLSVASATHAAEDYAEGSPLDRNIFFLLIILFLL